MTGQRPIKINGTSPRQIRAARVLLGWSQVDLAERAGLSATVIARVEAGTVDARLSTIEAILRALDENGIEFIANPDGTVGLLHHPGAGPTPVRDGARRADRPPLTGPSRERR